MELKRGKTFIKSSLQLSHEKPQVLAVTVQAKEDSRNWPVSLEGQQRPHGEKGLLVSPSLQEVDRFPSKGVQPDPKEGTTGLCGTTFKTVQKSKTQNFVPDAGTAATAARSLVGNVSFQGHPSKLESLGNCGGQRMIDYRHFVPQMPFVPAVAKSIPRKRISLKHPKKCFRNLFHLHRSKTENLTSPAVNGKALSLPRGKSEVEGRLDIPFFHPAEGLGSDSLCQELPDNDLPSDSSFDLCRALCEDVASLKSFDSLTGCGEIFADESTMPCLELNEGSESSIQEPEFLKSNVPRGSSQGGTEQLMSPTLNEVSEFAKFWDSANCSVRQQQHTLQHPWLGATQEPNTDQPRLNASLLDKLPLCPCRNPHSGSKASSVDTSTPKSEQPESVSTSDEGYYDSSPGLDEDKKEALSPGTPVATFPRDSYSGDALYELFYDPREGPVGPSLNDELCESESLSGPALDTHLSICSFHVGAEENLALPPSPDLLGQGFLQSSWKGKECLLKLCDTELFITMGIINWLRQSPDVRSPCAPAPGDASVPQGPQTAPGGQVEKLEVSCSDADSCQESLESKGDKPSDVGRATVCSAPSGQGLWMHSEAKGLPGRDSKIPEVTKWGTCCLSRGPSLEHLQVSKEGLFSSATMVVANSSGKNEASDPSAWSDAQKEARPSMKLSYLQGPWRIGLRESTLEQEPSLMDCVAQVAALQVQQDSQHLAESHQKQEAGNRLCGQPVARSPATPQQRDPCYLSSTPATHGPPSPGSPIHSPQDPRCLGYSLGLCQPRREQMGQLDSTLKPQVTSPGTWSLASQSQREGDTFTNPTDHCSH